MADPGKKCVVFERIVLLPWFDKVFSLFLCIGKTKISANYYEVTITLVKQDELPCEFNFPLFRQTQVRKS